MKKKDKTIHIILGIIRVNCRVFLQSPNPSNVYPTIITPVPYANNSVVRNFCLNFFYVISDIITVDSFITAILPRPLVNSPKANNNTLGLRKAIIFPSKFSQMQRR